MLVIIVGMSAYFGIQAALLDGQRFQHLWAAQAKEMQSLLRVAPCLRPDTVVMLQIAPGADPFGHQMWFNHALQLAYWHTPGVSGVYALSDGALGPGADQVTSWTNPANHARRPVLVLVERPDGSVQRREVPPISLVRAVGVDLNAALPIPQPCPARSSFGPQMVGAG